MDENFKLLAVIILFGGIGVYCWILIKAYLMGDTKKKTMLENSPFHSFGVPFSAMAAFGIVSLLDFAKSANEKLEFIAFNLQFKGPATPVILWALCFVVLVWAIKSASKP